jgi:hypothetical protein
MGLPHSPQNLHQLHQHVRLEDSADAQAVDVLARITGLGVVLDGSGVLERVARYDDDERVGLRKRSAWTK